VYLIEAGINARVKADDHFESANGR
jgi:hypothetical protein